MNERGAMLFNGCAQAKPIQHVKRCFHQRDRATIAAGAIGADHSHALPGAGKTDACRKPDGSSTDNDDIE